MELSTFAIQDKPSGLPEAFIIGQKFINKSKVMLILGDNFFYGQGLEKTIKEAIKSNKNSIFAYKVKDPKNYGVVKFSKSGKILKIYEKPKKFVSNYAIPGIYILIILHLNIQITKKIKQRCIRDKRFK